MTPLSGKFIDWFQLLGLLGVFAGLIFVGVQLRQDKVIASVDSTEDASAAMLAWAELVAEHPAVWVRGNSGEPLSKEELVVFDALARALDMHYFASWSRALRMDSEELAHRFVREAAYDIHASRGLYDFWQRHKIRMKKIDISNTAGEEWLASIDRQLEQYNSTDPIDK